MDPKAHKVWKEVQIKSGAELLKGATRLSVSGDGKVIAVVVTE
jgi:hypothetical protein